MRKKQSTLLTVAKSETSRAKARRFACIYLGEELHEAAIARASAGGFDSLSAYVRAILQVTDLDAESFKRLAALAKFRGVSVGELVGELLAGVKAG